MSSKNRQQRRKNKEATVEERVKELEERNGDEMRLREIISQEITKLVAAGGDTANDEEWMTQGDRNKSNTHGPAPVDEVVQELAEREKRKNNIILYGLPELKSKNSKQKNDHDKKKTLELLNTCKPEGIRMRDELDEEEEVRRLGPADPESTRPRPVLVKLRSDEEKKQLFMNLRNLKEANGDLKKLSVTHDLTKAQREEDKKLIERAKNMEDMETGNFIYRVRGPPWKRFIKKIPIQPRHRVTETVEKEQANHNQKPTPVKVNLTNDCLNREETLTVAPDNQAYPQRAPSKDNQISQNMHDDSPSPPLMEDGATARV